MLYSISDFLEQLNIPGARLWEYVSFRSLIALLLSLFISLWFGKRFIKYMKRNSHIESARDAETDPYGVLKKGVPSMGGVVIIAAVATAFVPTAVISVCGKIPLIAFMS